MKLLVNGPTNGSRLEDMLSEDDVKKTFTALMMDAAKLLRGYFASDEDIREILRQLAPSLHELALREEPQDLVRKAARGLVEREAISHVANDVTCWGRCVFPNTEVRGAKVFSAIADALSHLDDQEIEVLRGSLLERRDLHDIASRLSIKESEARETLLRGQYKLRKYLVSANAR